MALSAASRFDLLGNRRFHIKLTHLKVCLPGKRSKCTTWSRLIKYWGLGCFRFVQMTRPLAFTPLLFLLLWKPCGIAMRLGGASLPSVWSTGERVKEKSICDQGRSSKSTSNFLYASWTNAFKIVPHFGTLKMDWITFELSNLSREEGLNLDLLESTTRTLKSSMWHWIPHLSCRGYWIDLPCRPLRRMVLDCMISRKSTDFLWCSYIWFCVQTTKFQDICCIL